MSKDDVDHLLTVTRTGIQARLPQPAEGSRPGRILGRTSLRAGLGLLVALIGLAGLVAGESETSSVVGEPEAIGTPVLPLPGAANRDALPDALWQIAPDSVEQLRAIEEHVRQLVDRVSPAVVAVRIGTSTGSGAVVSPDGLVLSAAHVGVEPGRDVRFTFPDGRVARGQTLGMDHGMDAGLMRITDDGRWPHVPLGDPDSGRLGDWVLSLGHPGGFDAERPVLARLGRIIQRLGGSIRTDCTLVSGDSGGPLFDMHGRVIGIHSRISESTAANFHAPINTYVANWDRLARGDNWGARTPRPRAWVGLRGVDDPEGFRLDEVFENGPAFRAGLRDGDLVTRFNGQRVADSGSFLRALAQIHPGEQVTLEVRRDEAAWEVAVMVEARRRGGGRFGGR